MPSSISKAGKIVTLPASIPLLFLSEEFLNALGLEGANVKRKTRVISGTLGLGDGMWDDKTGGGIAVRTDFTLDREDRLRHFVMRYAAVHPDGRIEENNLVEFDTQIYGRKLKPINVTVLGRSVKDPHSVTRVLGALQHIHTDIRNQQFPDIGKILGDNGIDGLIGEKLYLPGLSKEGGFSFKPLLGQGAASASPFILPREFMPEFMGFGRNDLDPHQEFGGSREKQGFDRQNGAAFRFHAAREGRGEAHSFAASIEPLNPKQGHAIPDVADLHWRDTESSSTMDKFVLLGDEGADLSTVQRQKRLGVVNAANRDLRMRKYPSLPDHLTRFDQKHLLNQRVLLDTIDQFSRLVITPRGGRGGREYLPGMGGTIGMNLTEATFYVRGADGKVVQAGFDVDDGIGFSKKEGIQAGEQGSWSRVMAGPTRSKHKLITHGHIDHTGAIPDKMRSGMMSDVTVHADALDIRGIKDALTKAKIPQESWSPLHDLEGSGWIHQVEGGQRVGSAFYMTNAISHSRRVTAFILVTPPYPSDAEGKALNGKAVANPHYFAYAALGDMNFGEHNLPGYKGPKPVDTGFRRDLFDKFKEGLAAEYPDMTAEMRRKAERISAAEVEATSSTQKGFAPSVVTFERNLFRLADTKEGWFSGLGMNLNMLSASQRTDEAIFRVFNRAGRSFTGDGAYKEERLTDMNVVGVNPSVVKPHPDGDNINGYLGWDGRTNGFSPVKYYRRTAEEFLQLVREHIERTGWLSTGSQGTEIEGDSSGTQFAQGWSRWQLDPKYFRTAYDTDPKNVISLYIQSAIPGNEDNQLRQLRAMAYENDQMVGVAVRDGTRFFNLKEPYLSRIKSDLDRTGEKYEEEPRVGLFIHNFALYPPGHGWEEDFRQGILPWLKENGVHMIVVQHYSRNDNVYNVHKLADEADLRHTPEPIPNHVQWTIENGRHFTILGQKEPDFILARDNFRFGKYHGAPPEYLYVVVPASDGKLSDSGMFVTNNTLYFRDFGPGDYEQMFRDASKGMVRSRRDPEIAMLETPPDLGASRVMPMRGMESPLPLRKHPHLDMELDAA